MHEHEKQQIILGFLFFFFYKECLFILELHIWKLTNYQLLWFLSHPSHVMNSKTESHPTGNTQESNDPHLSSKNVGLYCAPHIFVKKECAPYS